MSAEIDVAVQFVRIAGIVFVVFDEALQNLWRALQAAGCKLPNSWPFVFCSTFHPWNLGSIEYDNKAE